MTTNWWDLPDEDEPKPWTLADIYNDLGTLLDVCEALDINTRRMNSWRARKERLKTPEPVRIIGTKPIWSIQEWRDWFYNFTKGRRPGTRWSTNAKPYTPPAHRLYGNEGLSTVLREAAAADVQRTTD